MKKTPGKRYFSTQEAVKNFKHAKRENQDSRGDGKKDFKHKKVGKFRKVQSPVCCHPHTLHSSELVKENLMFYIISANF